MMIFIPPPAHHPEQGNVLFFILIAVALFGALGYAVSQSGQSIGGGAISEEKSRILASEMMDYGQHLTSAVSKLRLSGCTLGQISFQNPPSADYANGAAPGDETCHVFSKSGGGVNWPHFSGDIFDDAWQAEADYGEPIFTIKNEIPQLGTDGDGANSYELLMLVEGMTTAMCNVINDRTKNDRTIFVANEVETKYDGTLNTTGTYTFPATFNGLRQGCYRDNSGADSGTLTYYFAIMIR